MARGCVIFPSISVFRVWAAFSSRATLMVFLGPSSVQYRLFPIQSTAIPSTLWMPLGEKQSGFVTSEEVKRGSNSPKRCPISTRTDQDDGHPAPWPRTVLQDGLPLRAIDLLAPDEVAGGVGEVDEAGLSVEVQGPGVHEVLDGDHVLVRHLGTHVHPADDAGTPLPVHQEQLVLGLCGDTGTAVATSRAGAVPWGWHVAPGLLWGQRTQSPWLQPLAPRIPPRKASTHFCRTSRRCPG